MKTITERKRVSEALSAYRSWKEKDHKEMKEHRKEQDKWISDFIKAIKPSK